MNRLRSIVWAGLLVATLPCSPAAASDPEDPCSYASLEDYLNALLGESQVRSPAGETVAGEEPFAARAAGRAATKAVAESLRLPSGEGAGIDGIDAYRKLFVALDLGTVSEEDKALTFSFRPELLDLGGFGDLAIRAVVREAVLFSPLAEAVDALPSGVGAARRNDLENALADLDDVEYQLAWTSHGRAKLRRVEERLDQEFQALYQAIRASNVAAAERLVAVNRALEAKLSASRAAGLAEYCVAERGEPAGLEEVRGQAAALLANARALQEALAASSALNLAARIAAEPIWALDVGFRDRAPEAGPDLMTAKLQFQIGDGSLPGADSEPRNFADLAADARRGATSLTDGKARLRLLAEYSETERYHFASPADELLVDQPRARVLAAALSVGRRVSAKQRTRFDLEAKYEDASGDPERNDRLVSTLSWTQKLSDQLATVAGGSNLVVALVYASRPEYRGEVDEELSLRAGLKWSIDGRELGAGNAEGE